VYDEYRELVAASAGRLGVATDALPDVVREIFAVIEARLHTVERADALPAWVYGVVRRTVITREISRLVREISRKPSRPRRLQATRDEGNRERASLLLLTKLLSELDRLFALVERGDAAPPERGEELPQPLASAWSRLRTARLAFEAALGRHEARKQRS
jgi:RNA polymerase sigma-70 factor (ECF subfamily)